ncbi:MAG: radical SAM family heme chaperone HemW [Bacteroidota bacterium]
MAGIYIHIPFCKQKCHYCNFYTTVSHSYHHEFISSLISEIARRKQYLENKIVDTIYFGGGTPSILSIDEINLIINTIYQEYNVSINAEITLEANPDDLCKEKLFDIKSYTKINRLSIGIQSFFDDDLHYLNRVHSGNQAHTSIENALLAGFENITIDLIYGIPTLTNKKWKENLNRFFDYGVPHLSSYSLTIEPKTALDVLIRKNKIENIVEKESIEHFEILLNETQKYGLLNYEISNFAKDGYFSKHNSNYWLGKHYLGVGPSAHSYNGKSRQWNIRHIKRYCEGKPEDLMDDKELLTQSQQYNEYVLTSIRTSWGCDVEHIKKVFGAKYGHHFIKKIYDALMDKKVIKTANIYTLTNKGKLFADGIASDLFYSS